MKVAKIFGVHPAVLISPIDIICYNSYIILFKVIRLIEIKLERPEVAQPLLSAINGLLEHLPGEYQRSWETEEEKPYLTNRQTIK
jgi:hypothetical protein